MPEPRKTTTEPEAGAEVSDLNDARRAQINDEAAAPGQEVLPPDPQRAEWVRKIAGAWNTSVENILETGRQLIAAKAALPHGTFQAMVDFDLPFSPGTASRLMTIGADVRFVAHGPLLPPYWRTLYELTKVPALEFDKLIEDGTITPDLERHTIEQINRDRETADAADAPEDAAPSATTTRVRATRPTREKSLPEQKEVRAVCTALQAMNPDQLRYIWKEV